jgi:bacterioferritin
MHIYSLHDPAPTKGVSKLIGGLEEVKVMESKGRKIVALDVRSLLELLNKAFADEWLSHYQYWIGAKVVKGPMRKAAVPELREHAKEEYKHAGMLAERIIQLGGTPILKTEEWHKLTNCGYEAPEDPSVMAILKQNVKAEQCAIDVYKHLLDTTRDKDEVTWKMVLEILDDEVEHEADLQALLEDIDMMKL